MMKIGIYDPYWDTLGGGERYTLNLATCLAKKGNQVDLFWDDVGIGPKIKERLGFDLKGIDIVPNVFRAPRSQRWRSMRSYDLLFFLSDGSLPFLFGKRNFVYFCVPFRKVKGQSLANKLKLRSVNKVMVISQFTKKFIDREYGVKSEILYPAAAVDKFKPLAKKKMILSVARFTADLNNLHNKRQDVLVEVFKEMCDRGLKDWQLILAGGTQKSSQLVAQLKKQSQGYPIKILTNISFKNLQLLYGQAKIFWHAAGFGEDEEKNPEKMEHFGIVAVEAMASGCVPVVIGKGGLKEIIDNGKTGFLWQNKKELADQTLAVINSSSDFKKLALAAAKASQRFSEKAFCQKLNEIIKS